MTFVPLLRPPEFFPGYKTACFGGDDRSKHSAKELQKNIDARQTIIDSLGGEDAVRRIPVYTYPKERQTQTEYMDCLKGDNVFKKGQYIVQTIDNVGRKAIVVRMQQLESQTDFDTTREPEQNIPSSYLRLPKFLSCIAEFSPLKVLLPKPKPKVIIGVVFQRFTETCMASKDSKDLVDSYARGSTWRAHGRGPQWRGVGLGDPLGDGVESIAKNLEALTKNEHPKLKFFPKE